MSETTTITASLNGEAHAFAMRQIERYRNRLEAIPRTTLETIAMLLIQKRSVDGLNGRRWDASAHLLFEDAVEALLKLISRDGVDGKEGNK